MTQKQKPIGMKKTNYRKTLRIQQAEYLYYEVVNKNLSGYLKLGRSAIANWL